MSKDRITYDTLEAKARKQAVENIDKWGLLEKEVLLLAMFEEMGELTQAHLGKQDLNSQYNELYDLMAMMYAYWLQLERIRYNGKYYESELKPER